MIQMFELVRISCEEVLPSVILFIDNELPDENQYLIFTIHFQECPPCCQVMEHERTTIALMQKLLRNSCNEEAPAGLDEKIRRQTDQLAGQYQTEFFSQTTITELTMDGYTSIHVTQQYTEQVRHEFFSDE